MKLSTQLLLGIICLIVRCHGPTEEVKFFIETKPSFYDLRHGSWVENKWIRKPENLLFIHETFKKFGYAKLISERLLYENPLIIQDIYINRKGKDLLDSLELTFTKSDLAAKYYKEFWNRRRAEKNAEVVFKVIKDINSVVRATHSPSKTVKHVQTELVNDTLLSLLQIEYSPDTLTNKLAENELKVLKELGFHKSAYNLLYESDRYLNITIDREGVLKTLKPSNAPIRPWFEDNSP